MEFAQAVAETGQSRYSLHINDSPVQPDVLRFRGREALSEPFSWNIEFTVPPGDIAAQDVLLKYASLRMRNGKEVHGIITFLKCLCTSADQSRYAVRLESRLALLSHTSRCAIYQNMSVPELVEHLLRRHGLVGVDFDFRLERQYPVREPITQWNETDLQFIQRILSEVGIWFRSEMHAVTRQETLIFADSQLNYEFHVTLPYGEPSGLYDGAEESCWNVRTWHNAVTGRVSTRNDNYRDWARPVSAEVSMRSSATTTGETYRYGGTHLTAGDDTDPEPETESGAFYARIHHERELNRSAILHLFSNASGLTPGQVLEPQGNIIEEMREGVVIGLVTFIASHDSRLHVSAWGMPYTERYCYRPPEIPRPEIHGTLPGRVDSRSPDEPYAWLDEQGRYRVRMDFDRDQDCEPGYAFPWLRLSNPVAGDVHGFHFPLVHGTEVAVAFHAGDPDLPYIAYVFHDSEHADVVTRDNRSQNILRTAGDNELRMEDKRQEEHIALTTPFGATQLNQGHITDAQDKPRGSGFELRTDEHGVIRVAKGLLVTADGQQKAEGDILEMDTALREIEFLQQQLQALNSAAVQARALEADIASQKAMFAERFRELEEMIHFSAPEGMAFTSGEHIQLAASENIAVNAGGDISAGAIGNVSMLAGEKVGLFAHTGKLSVVSAEGPVQFQAQNGSMHLSAEQKLRITSLSEMLFAGKKRVTLIGGGSYLKIDEAGIEYGTTNTYTRYAKRTVTAGPATVLVEFPSHPEPGEPVLSPDDHLFS
ncbi:type VI secretion system tip protein VgrG [Enterobacter cloacae complex sp. ECC445]|uniref:type VI secretion system Vgr family protein n=1 Tax=Enterobacter cloacae complex sp. ECC445 TaxID=2913213 RepID=UPI001F4358D3|nr:type VI secretion system Vgr family protein [Enterobacter cloacae complex sp. ECC445]MCG0456234.1 type VI secretion system tip protein VgrG [Enterobacter cloacae complex sp. ECC445]